MIPWLIAAFLSGLIVATIFWIAVTRKTLSTG
jgi:hypothetical protein